MVKWSKVCRSKKKGGLGILDLHKQKTLACCVSGGGNLRLNMVYGRILLKLNT
jgi:hypothetical protein